MKPSLKSARGSNAVFPRPALFMLASKVPLIARLIRATVAVLLLLTGLGIAALLARTSPEARRTGNGAEPPRVQVLIAQRVPVARRWQGWGVADALIRADVPARVAATVEDIPGGVQAGRRVQRDDLLVLLDASDFQRQAQIARQRLAELDAMMEQLLVEERAAQQRLEVEQHNLELATAERERVERLAASKVANRQDVDAARRSELVAQAAVIATRESLSRIPGRRAALDAQRQGQYAALQQAEQDIERSRVRSPISGVLQSVDVKSGEFVAAGSRVARVVDLSRVEVPLQLPSAAQQDLALGDVVTLTAANDPSRRWTARITRLAPESDPQGRTITAYVEVDQPGASSRFGEPGAGDLLIPGRFVEATVQSQRTQERFVLPRRAVRGGYAMVVTDGVLQSRPVEVLYVFEGQMPQIAATADDQWAVIEGRIDAGDQVLLSATATLLDGAAVTAVPVEVATATAARPAPPQEVAP